MKTLYLCPFVAFSLLISGCDTTSQGVLHAGSQSLAQTEQYFTQATVKELVSDSGDALIGIFPEDYVQTFEQRWAPLLTERNLLDLEKTTRQTLAKRLTLEELDTLVRSIEVPVRGASRQAFESYAKDIENSVRQFVGKN